MKLNTGMNFSTKQLTIDEYEKLISECKEICKSFNSITKNS